MELRYVVIDFNTRRVVNVCVAQETDQKPDNWFLLPDNFNEQQKDQETVQIEP